MSSQPKDKEEKPKHAINFLPPPKLSHAEIKKRMIERLEKREYEGIKQDLELYRLTSEQISDFFLKEGPKLLTWSLIGALPEGPLQLWSEVISKDVFMSVLSNDNFSILRSFLKVQVELERKGWQTEEKEKGQIKVFSILLSVDANAISVFMKENANDTSLISEKIKNNFAMALHQPAESTSSSAAPSK